MWTRPAAKLTHRGAQHMIAAAVAEAETIGAAVNIVIVDECGVDLAMLRMDGAKFLSMETARAKARTAASHCVPTTQIDPDIASELASASKGAITRMAGGLPIMLDGVCIGGIGIGSAADAVDVQIASAVIASLGRK